MVKKRMVFNMIGNFFERNKKSWVLQKISQHHLQFRNSMRMVGISCYQKEVLERLPTGYCWG